jgi:surface antigen
LEAQISGLQAQITANQAKNEKLKSEIDIAQKELDKQKKLLGENIKAMYLEGQISTLEMLASSKDLSEFVDKEQYRDAVKSKIKTSLDRVTDLKTQLKNQKEAVEKLLAEQQSLRSQVASQRAQQERLLSLNQSQQDSFNQDIQANQDKIKELKRQQVLENVKLFGGGVQPGIPGGGGYPWGNAYCAHTGQVGGDCWNYDWEFNGSPWDSWGYGFRNCTSWVAYKLASDGKVGFTYLGNATNWPSGAAARGIAVSYGSGARPGDAAVRQSGYYGHVMYVEAVTGDGQVIVSDYNRMGDGLYRGPDGGSAAVLSQSGLAFIHF